MPLGPRPADVPRIRLTLKVFRISAIVTGVFLLFLVVMMVSRYIFFVDIEYSGAYGLGFTPRELIEERGTVNVSNVILTVHGWLYVVYMALNFLLWRFTRWSFGRFLFIALGGIIPLLSFFFEFRVPRWVREALAKVEPAAVQTQEAPA
jgi:integral membrane protein